MVFVSSSVDSDLVQSIIGGIGPQARSCTSISEETYRTLSRGGRAQRLWLRVLNWLVHPCRLVATICRAPRGSLFVVTTNPFFAPVVAAAVAPLCGHRVVHHVFDLYPDALEAAGVLKSGGLGSRWITSALRWAQRRCTGAVYLGQELRRQAENRLGAVRASAVIEVTADESLFQCPLPERNDCLVLHYGGQLGAMHDAQSLVDLVGALADERRMGRVRFDFRVGGAKSEVLFQLRGQPGVCVEPVLVATAWREHIRSVGVGLVTLAPAGARVCLPSKTYAMLAAGLPVLAICPPQSDLFDLVQTRRVGWSVDNSLPGNPDALDSAGASRRAAQIVRRLIADPKERDRCAALAGSVSRTLYSRAATASRWREFLTVLR
jgi:hypothetical protein